MASPGGGTVPRTIAELPEAAYAVLDGIAERIAISQAGQADQTAYQGG